MFYKVHRQSLIFKLLSFFTQTQYFQNENSTFKLVVFNIDFSELWQLVKSLFHNLQWGRIFDFKLVGGLKSI